MADLFDLTGKVAVVTGGYGVLGGSMARALATAGARVVVLGRNRDAAETLVASIRESGAEAMTAVADVTDEKATKAARNGIIETWGQVDILVNAAGGNVARARSDTSLIFTIPYDSFDEVLKLNLHGTVFPSLAFGAAMAERGRGSIVNISSMASTQALSGVMGYSAAKAAVDNFTRWLAVDMARNYGDGIRVNAIAPGFFISTQNRAVLVKDDGSYTERAKSIVAKTPMGRFGDHAELHGALLYLCSDAASFVTGTVLPVDGGFSAFSGV